MKKVRKLTKEEIFKRSFDRCKEMRLMLHCLDDREDYLLKKEYRRMKNACDRYMLRLYELREQRESET